MASVVTVRGGETIYDMAWLPGMNSADPSTCCFFSTSRDHPVHAWDAFTGQSRGSYCAYTDAEELEAGNLISIGFYFFFCSFSSHGATACFQAKKKRIPIIESLSHTCDVDELDEEVFTHACIYACTCVRMRICVRVWVQTYTLVSSNVYYLRAHVCMHVCIHS
jgi:hypothetical protein